MPSQAGCSGNKDLRMVGHSCDLGSRGQRTVQFISQRGRVPHASFQALKGSFRLKEVDAVPVQYGGWYRTA